MAGLLKTQPGAGQMFCRLLAAPLLAAADPAKAAGEWWLALQLLQSAVCQSSMHHVVRMLLSLMPGMYAPDACCAQYCCFICAVVPMMLHQLRRAVL